MRFYENIQVIFSIPRQYFRIFYYRKLDFKYFSVSVVTERQRYTKIFIMSSYRIPIIGNWVDGRHIFFYYLVPPFLNIVYKHVQFRQLILHHFFLRSLLFLNTLTILAFTLFLISYSWIICQFLSPKKVVSLNLSNNIYIRRLD